MRWERANETPVGILCPHPGNVLNSIEQWRPWLKRIIGDREQAQRGQLGQGVGQLVKRVRTMARHVLPGKARKVPQCLSNAVEKDNKIAQDTLILLGTTFDCFNDHKIVGENPDGIITSPSSWSEPQGGPKRRVELGWSCGVDVHS